MGEGGESGSVYGCFLFWHSSAKYMWKLELEIFNENGLLRNVVRFCDLAAVA